MDDINDVNDMFAQDESVSGHVSPVSVAPPSRYQAAMRRIQAGMNHDDVAGVNPVDDPIDRDEDIKGQWEFWDFDEDDWSTIQEEWTDDPTHCYLCEKCQNSKEAEANPYLKGFHKYLADNYPKMTRMALAMQGQKIYNQYLRPHSDEKKPMRCKTIIDHIERHAPTVRIQLEHMNRTLNNCLMEQSAQLRQRDKATQKSRLHPTNATTYVKLASFQNDVIAKLLKIRPDTKK
jgi:23S rRNA maturation mini-RNase III